MSIKEGIGGLLDRMLNAPSVFKNLRSQGVSTFSALSSAITGSTTALYSFLGVAAGIAAIIGIKAAMDRWVYTFDESADAAEAASTAYEKQTEKVESINTELETMRDRIDELQAKGTLTLTEDAELERLQSETAELEKQLEFEKALAEQRGRESASAIKKALDNNGLVYSDGRLKEDSFLNELGNTFSMASGLHVRESKVTITEGLDLLLDRYEEIQQKQDELRQDRLELDPKVDSSEIDKLSSDIDAWQDKADETATQMTSWVEQLSSYRTQLLDAGVSENDAYIKEIDTVLDRWTRLVEGMDIAQTATGKAQSRIDEVLSSPKLTDTIDIITQIAKELNGISEEGLAGLREEFPELDKAISDALGNSSKIIDSFKEQIGSLGESDFEWLSEKLPDFSEDLSAAMEDGTITAGELNSVIDNLSKEDLDTLSAQFPVLGNVIANAMENGVISVQDFQNALNSLAGTRDYNTIRNQLKDSLNLVSDDVFGPPTEAKINEVKAMIDDGLSDEEIDMWINLGYDVGSMTMEEISDAIQKMREEAEEAAHSIEGMAESVSGFESSVSAVQSAMSSNGTVGYDTYSSEELKDYAGALEFVNGEYRYNEEAVRAITEAKREELKANIEVAKSLKQQEYLENAKDISKMRDELEELGDEQKRVKEQEIEKLISDNQDIEREIQGFNVLSAQIDNTFDKYQEWLNMKNASSQGEMLGELGEALQLIDDTLHNAESDSWMRIGEANYGAAVKFLVGDVDAAEEEIDAAFNRISRYFQQSEEGAFTGKSNVGAIITDLMDDGFLDYNNALDRYELATGVTTQEIADKWGITKDAVWALFQEINAYLKDEDKISIGDEFSRSVDQMGTDVSRAVESLKAIGVLGEDFTINMDLSGYDTVEDKINAIDGNVAELEDVLVQFEDDPASYSVIQTAIHDLLLMKEQLQTPTKVALDASGLTDETATIYNALYDIQQAYEQIQHLTELQETTGVDFSADISELEDKAADAQDILKEYEDSETLAKIGIDPDSMESIKNAITNDGNPYNVYVQQHLVDAYGNEITSVGDTQTGEDDRTATVTYVVDEEEVDAFLAKKIDRTAIVSYLCNHTSVDSFLRTLGNRTYTITYKVNTVESGSSNGKTGTQTTQKTPTQKTQSVLGTAYARGTWGTKESGEFLVGELGPELVVNPHTGKWYTVGDKGAQFVNLPKGAIVFNHLQTEDLLRDGSTLGRALGITRALAAGNALATGGNFTSDWLNKIMQGAGYSGSNTSGYNASSSANRVTGDKTASGDEDNWFERQYAYHNHLVNMEQETVSKYLKWLDTAYQKAYKEQKIELEDYYKYQEEVFEKLREVYKDSLDDIEHNISMLEHYEVNDPQIVDAIKGMMESIENEIAAARNAGLTDNDAYIQELQDRWWECSDKLRDMFADSLDDIEHNISMFEHYEGSEPKIVKSLTGMMSSIEKEIAAAREAGLTDNDAYIQELQERWWECHDQILDIEETTQDEARTSLEELIQIRINMLKQQVDDQKSALEDELDAEEDAHDKKKKLLEDELDDIEEKYDKEKELLDDRLDNLKEFYDRQRELLQDQADEDDYLKEQAEKRKAVSDLEMELQRLNLDNSAWASKRKAEINQQLVEALDDLNEFEREHALQIAQDQLDAQEEAQTRAIEDEQDRLDAQYEIEKERINQEMEDIDALYEARRQNIEDEIASLELSIASQSQLRQQAITDLRNDNGTILSEMTKWNQEYGTGVDNDVTEKWKNAEAALQSYYNLYGQYYQGIQLKQQTGVSSDAPQSLTPDAGASWDKNQISQEYADANKKPTTSKTPTSTKTPSSSKTPASSKTPSSSSKKPSTSSTQKKPSTESKTPKLTDDIKRKVAAAIWNGTYGWGSGQDRVNKLTEVFGSNNGIQNLVSSNVGRYDSAPSKDYTYLNMRKKFKGYASGTRSALPGLRQIDELGPEYLFTSSDGNKYRVFSGGEKVLSAKATDFLYEFANSGSEILSNMITNMFKSAAIDNGAVGENVGSIRLGDIIIQGNADEKTVSEIRRAQKEEVNFILKKFGKLKQK